MQKPWGRTFRIPWVSLGCPPDSGKEIQLKQMRLPSDVEPEDSSQESYSLQGEKLSWNHSY